MRRPLSNTSINFQKMTPNSLIIIWQIESSLWFLFVKLLSLSLSHPLKVVPHMNCEEIKLHAQLHTEKVKWRQMNFCWNKFTTISRFKVHKIKKAKRRIFHSELEPFQLQRFHLDWLNIEKPSALLSKMSSKSEKFWKILKTTWMNSIFWINTFTTFNAFRTQTHVYIFPTCGHSLLKWLYHASSIKQMGSEKNSFTKRTYKWWFGHAFVWLVDPFAFGARMRWWKLYWVYDNNNSYTVQHSQH